MRALILACSLLLTGCGLVEVREPEAVATLRQEIQAATSARADAELQADAAIRTSAQAREAEARARQERDAAREIADEKDGEVRRLDRLANELRNQEIAAGIRRASWWSIAAGGLALVAGIALAIWLHAPYALRLAGSGAAVVVVGLVGRWIAPHWLWVAWVAGALAVLAALVVAARAYLHQQRALSLTAGLADDLEAAQDGAAAVAAKLKARAAQEAAGVRRLIQRVRGKS